MTEEPVIVACLHTVPVGGSWPARLTKQMVGKPLLEDGRREVGTVLEAWRDGQRIMARIKLTEPGVMAVDFKIGAPMYAPGVSMAKEGPR